MQSRYITLSHPADAAGTTTLTHTEDPLGVLTIRNVDDDVIAALKARARANHRSLEGELRYLLARSAAPRPALGLVRERARMAARYRAGPTAPADVRVTTAEADRQAADPGPDVQEGCAEWMGSMSDVGEIVGDIMSPASEPSDWDALRPETAEPNGVEKP